MRVSLRANGASARDLRRLLQTSAVALVELDRDGTVRAWNAATERLLGWRAAELLGQPLPEAVLGRPVDLPALLNRLAGTQTPPTVRVRCRHRRGWLVQVEFSPVPLYDRHRRVRGVVGALMDVTARCRLERRLRYQAEHDSLTQLPNRDALLARLVDALAAGARTGLKTGLLIVDLDGFKEVNDTLGHASGDQLLTQVGPRLLSGTVRANDIVARLAGDEFAVLLPGLEHAKDAVSVATRVLKALDSSFVLASATVDVAASIGIAVAPDHAQDPTELLRLADTAMYEAKDRTAGVTLYRPDRGGHAPTRFGLLGELRRALDRRELIVHYQPKVDLETCSPCGAEALVRWQHPTRGLLGPGEFIPIAETTGLMRRVTDYVLELALAQVQLWIKRGHEIPVSVNLSARELHDHTLPGRVLGALERHHVPLALLYLEITETAVMHDPDSALAVLAELAQAGVGISIDDFGTGYSSMSYLQRLPAVELKVDRSFVTGLRGADTDSMLVRSTVDLGHNLGLRVVAEGVEDQAALTELHELGCDIAQGYYFARPMPASEFVAWLAADGNRANAEQPAQSPHERHLSPTAG